ncbi:MAG: alkaline shock response membrane anchor protein AmaP [Hamadaea sp.]|nr:alkaline shock response membrane anchor protein AmaP [Hamadaea sp.]NUT02067.1 alkaline shock response membrane anchor protein AmaP [Hamadaea sp.]
MHADRTNRTVLTIIGFLLLAAGVATATAAFGGFGDDRAARLLAANRVWTYAGDNGRWLWPAVGVLALIVLLLALRWLVAILFSTDRVRKLRLRADESRDRVTLAAPAVGDAVQTEVQSYRGVRSAHARLVGEPDDPVLAIEVDTDLDADLAALRDRIEQDAVAHARQALDRPDLRVRLDLEAQRQAGVRVH